jgi:hypothetical protein
MSLKGKEEVGKELRKSGHQRSKAFWGPQAPGATLPHFIPVFLQICPSLEVLNNGQHPDHTFFWR